MRWSVLLIALLTTTTTACFDPENSPDLDGSSGASGEGTESTTTLTTSTTDPTTSSTTNGPTSTTTSDPTSGTETTTTDTTGEPTTSAGSSGGSTGSPVEYAHTLYLNFDGITLASGAADDAPNDVTGISMMATDLEAYGVSPQPEQIVTLVQEDFAPYDILVTDVRPSEGDYTMIVVTPTNPFGMGVMGISLLDCSNLNPNNIPFAFFGAGSGFTNLDQANVISSEVAHSMGLENITEDVGDPMYRFLTDSDKSFLDACYDLEGNPAVCIAEHDAQCGAGTNQQNSHRELLEVLGPSPV